MSEEYLKYLVIASGVLSLFFKVPRYEIRLWQYLLEGLGNALNRSLTAKIADLSNQVTALDKLLNDHIKTQDEGEITACRRRILRFDDEVRMGIKHSREHWDNIMEDRDSYTQYCHSHPNYENSKAEKAMSHLTETYDELTPQDFL